MTDPTPTATAPPAPATPNATMTERDFYDCYDDSWRGLITPSAHSHPAKFAYGLLSRLYDHGFAQGWWKKGDVIGDPFGGVTCGGIVAAYNGLSWRGVELEPKFVALAQENIELHRRRWEGLGDPVPEIIQGDSRQFAELLKASAIVTSPPWSSDRVPGSDTAARSGQSADGARRGGATVYQYGNSVGQIGSLEPGNLDAVVTSPPYINTNVGNDDAAAELRRLQEKMNNGTLGRENLRMARKGKLCPHTNASLAHYGQTAGQIGQLKEGAIDAVVTSPPYEKSLSDNGDALERVARSELKKGKTRKDSGILRQREGGCMSGYRTYTGEAGSLCSMGGETYWQAVAAVYRSCHAALRPAGHLCCVVKDFVRDRARVPLCDQTMRLLESIGFVPVERIRCWLVKEKREAGLFGEDVVTKTEKKSFFRRLQESKGSPRIDFEEILVVRRGGM